MSTRTPQPVPVPKKRRFMNQAEVEQTWNTRTWREHMRAGRRRRPREERKARAERLTEKQRRKLMYAGHLAGEH